MARRVRWPLWPYTLFSFLSQSIVYGGMVMIRRKQLSWLVMVMAVVLYATSVGCSGQNPSSGGNTPPSSGGGGNPIPVPSGWTIDLQASATSAAAGQAVTLTATTNQDITSKLHFSIVIADQPDGKPVCAGLTGTKCTATVRHTGTSMTYQAAIVLVGDPATAGTRVAVSKPVTVTWRS
jgi:hypothetical protein